MIKWREKREKRREGAGKRSTVYRKHTVDVKAQRESESGEESVFRKKTFIFLFTFLARDILAAVITI